MAIKYFATPTQAAADAIANEADEFMLLHGLTETTNEEEEHLFIQFLKELGKKLIVIKAYKASAEVSFIIDEDKVSALLERFKIVRSIEEGLECKHGITLFAEYSSEESDEGWSYLVEGGTCEYLMNSWEKILKILDEFE